MNKNNLIFYWKILEYSIEIILNYNLINNYIREERYSIEKNNIYIYSMLSLMVGFISYVSWNSQDARVTTKDTENRSQLTETVSKGYLITQ